MPIRVKICGITSAEDGVLAASLGAAAIGLVFWEESPRCVTPERAAAIGGGGGTAHVEGWRLRGRRRARDRTNRGRGGVGRRAIARKRAPGPGRSVEPPGDPIRGVQSHGMRACARRDSGIGDCPVRRARPGAPRGNRSPSELERGSTLGRAAARDPLGRTPSHQCGGGDRGRAAVCRGCVVRGPSGRPAARIQRSSPRFLQPSRLLSR